MNNIFNTERKGLKPKSFLIVFPIAIVVFILLFINQSKYDSVKTEQSKDNFYTRLETENLFFTGIVRYKESIAYGDGFICLEKIVSNKSNGYNFDLDKYAPILIGKQTVKMIGNVSILNVGDSVVFNNDSNKKVEYYRNGVLIFSRKAYIHNVYYSKKLKYFDCR